ncbi:MAG: glutathione S-transferase family protein [Alphaproteobacteria bacterium]|nr:glutathione S-transferase family protein [Alphaproteobacteria bacterium]
MDLTLTTFDWVPERPRGYVRDLRVRWALEEAGLPYRVATVPFHTRGAEHVAHQPFAQVPWLSVGAETIFESGAILLFLGEHSAALLPTAPQARREAIQWMVASLNSIEPPVIAWLHMVFAGDPCDGPGAKRLITLRDTRLRQLEGVSAERTWIAGSFSAADILLADALRLFDGTQVLAPLPACQAYLDRAITRPAFARALADHLAHFSAPTAAS